MVWMSRKGFNLYCSWATLIIDYFVSFGSCYLPIPEAGVIQHSWRIHVSALLGRNWGMWGFKQPRMKGWIRMSYSLLDQFHFEILNFLNILYFWWLSEKRDNYIQMFGAFFLHCTKKSTQLSHCINYFICNMCPTFQLLQVQTSFCFVHAFSSWHTKAGRYLWDATLYWAHGTGNTKPLC